MDDPAREEESGLLGRPPRQRGPLPSILFIMLMLLLFTSHNGEEYLARHQYQEALQQLTYQTSNYTAWLNGSSSNFSLPEYNSPLLDTVLPSNGSVDPAYASYYPNITGFIHGDLAFYNLTQNSSQTELESYPWKSNDNMTQVLETLGTWNWSAPSRVAFSVVEKVPLLSANSSENATEQIAFIHGRIEFSDPTIGQDLRLQFEGIHFLKNGSIYGLAEPPGHVVDIRLLPSIVPEEMRNETAFLIEPELTSRINKLKDLIDAGIIEESVEDESPKTSCPFALYAQIDSVDVPNYVMQEYEEEIQRPTGIKTKLPSRLGMNSVLVSEECGILYKVGKMEGLRSRTFFRKVTTYAGTAALVYLILLLLFTRQMARSSTPSGISRVSRYTFLVQSTIDSVSFAGHVTFAVLAEGRPSLSLMAPSFLACVVFLYQAQFSMSIYQIQLPEDTPSPPPPPPPPVTASTPEIVVTAPTPSSNPTNGQTPPASASDNSNSGTNSGTSTTTQPGDQPASAPATTPTTSTPTPQTAAPAGNQNTTQTPTTQNMTFWAFFWQQIRSDPQARLYILLFIFLSTIVRIILSPTLTLLFVAVTYSCIWLPQILRSIRRGRSSGLTVEYIIGTSVGRIFLMLYFLGCPRNVLDVEPRYWSFYLALFVCSQAMVLILQEYFGPAFFLPRRFSTVNTYNYHPPLPLPDEESPEQSLGDCAICMDTIVIDPVAMGRQHQTSDKGKESSLDDWDAKTSGSDARRKSLSGGRPGGLLGAVQRGVESAVTRKNYSLAPCHHLFHTECLERWLAIKNICPQCRRPLPPL